MSPESSSCGRDGGLGHCCAALLASVSSRPGPRALMSKPPSGSPPGGFYCGSFADLSNWFRS